MSNIISRFKLRKYNITNKKNWRFEDEHTSFTYWSITPNVESLEHHNGKMLSHHKTKEPTEIEGILIHVYSDFFSKKLDLIYEG